MDSETGWTKPEADLLSGFTNLYHPTALYEPEREYPYRLYFFGWADDDSNPGYPGSDAIFHARSHSIDGPWEAYGGNDWYSDDAIGSWEPVMTADNAFYDNWHNGDPSIVKREGTYYMLLSTTGFVDAEAPPEEHPEADAGHKSCILGARSQDGINWVKSDEPLLISRPDRYPDDYTHDHYVGIFHRPSLLYDEDRWRCWFDYKPGGGRGLSLGHAVCEGDPMRAADWTISHRLDEPLVENWDNPDVINIDDRYYMVGDPHGYGEWIGEERSGWADRQVRFAVSEDGIDWRLLDYVPPDADTPANQVPVFFRQDEDLYVFYSCQIGGEPYDHRFDRIRYMHRPIETLPLP